MKVVRNTKYEYTQWKKGYSLEQLDSFFNKSKILLS